ncbi:hypothetical protein DR864_11165 [Runella rosea]|uniref:Cytochrome C Planctomycete-type domain-containing protein n=1 Tax=Runella rosea TaxID=2259595 RepID=A0A344THZ2_9BACT|nr:hypothetical protein [Runella rosea]AXE18263.1 hypothetical protein DR864_11165 [Runella rosea]
MKTLNFFLFIGIVGLFISCLYDKPTPETSSNTTPGPTNPSNSTNTATGITLTCTIVPNTTASDQVCFNTQILPLIVSNCATSGCHDAKSREDGYELTSYKTITSKGINISKPLSSKLYQVMIDTGKDRMPPSTPLSKAQTALFLKWIQQGAKETICNVSVDTTNVTFSKSVKPLLDTYCVGCHKTGASSGSVLLDSYNSVKIYVDNQRLFGTMGSQQGYSPMPPTGKLTDCQLLVVQKWILQGAKND